MYLLSLSICINILCVCVYECVCMYVRACVFDALLLMFVL